MKKRLLSALLAVSMMLSLFPTSAFAAASRMGEAYSSDVPTATYNLGECAENGVLTIKATGADTYEVTQDTTTNTITASKIIITGTAPSGFALTVDGAGSAANVTLNGVTVDNSAASGKPGMTVKGTVTLTLEGENALSGGNNCAGLQKVDDKKTLTITGSGDLKATGSSFSAGIGGGYGASSGNIIFQGSGTIEAAGSSGIGSGCAPGYYPDGHDISIISGTINATTTNTSGAAIGGGGYTCSGYNIYISGGKVTASGGYTGIGGGYGSGNIYISGSDTIVNATGNTAGIGGQYSGTIEITGGDVTATGRDVGIGAYKDAGSITISGGSVKATGTEYVGIGAAEGDASNITVSGGSVKVLSSLSGIGSYNGTASVTIKEDAKVAIYRNDSLTSYVYVGSSKEPTDAAGNHTRTLRASSAGLTTGYVYCYQSVTPSIPETVTSPDIALPVYSIKVNGFPLNGYTALYGLTTNNAKFTYDPVTKELSSTASLNENQTIEVDNNNTYASNNDLRGKVAVELTNTNKNTSGEYTTGTLTTTGAGDVTVKNNFSCNVTLDGENITPADQPNDYTKATEGKKLVITPVPNYNLTVTNGKAYADEAHTKELRTAKNSTVYRTVADCTVYLKGIAPDNGKFYKFTGWTATTPAGLTVANTAAADTSFTMPAEAAALTAKYVEAYTVTVDDQLLKDDRGNTLYFAKDDTVHIESTAPATDDGTHPNALFANWSGPDDVKFTNKENAATTFTMPDHNVSVETVKKYKVAVTGGTAYTDNENAAAAVIYAKKDDTVHLQYTASGPFKQWNCANGTITINPKTDEGALPGQASFSMPGQPVAVSAEVGLIPMTKNYGILVQLPEGETFVDGSTPVTVTVTDTPTGAETPDDTNTPSAQTADISSPVFAKAGQTVTLKFDLSSLPVGSEKAFGEWKVVSLAPAQPDNTDGTDTTADGDTGSIATTPVTVKNSGSATDASFVMPAAPVVVTFTLNTLPTSDDPADGSEPSIAGGIVAGTLIGGATYLVGTDFWLNCLYGFLPIDRIQLAEALWNKADCPAPVSAELYPDIDEDDTDAQAAARWCVEQGLMKDYSGTDKDGSEEVTFKPCGYVFRPQAIKAWYDLEKLLNEQQ